MTILQSAIAQSAGGATGYQIARSLRVNSADSAYLNRTFGSGGNRRTWTWSGWIKRSMLSDVYGDRMVLFGGFNSNSNTEWIEFGFGNSGDGTWNTIYSTTAGFGGNTTSLYRDISAHYHVVIALDTTQATQANRLKIYINGVLTDFPSASFGAIATQNVEIGINGAWGHAIGRSPYSAVARNFNGYVADVRFIDGQALDPTSFGEFDANTGVWNPIAYTGTYGTNGFWLKLDDNSNNTAATLGKDSSGNSNNWTPNNFSVTAGAGNDSLVDSPTNYGTDTGAGGEVRGNYATLNPLMNNATSPGTLVNGNLQYTTSSSSSNGSSALGTIAISSGKWYWETQITANPANGAATGIVGTNFNPNASADSGFYFISTGYGYRVDGNKVNNSTGPGSAYGATYTTNDIIGVALDLDAGTLAFYKNGVSQGTAYSSLSGTFYAAIYGYTSLNYYVNFGQRPFAYTAPSGFKALCTQNLPTPAIGATSSTLASKNMNVVTYTGNGTTNNITGVGFQPDLVWAKARSNAASHSLFDAVRGVRKVLSSNLTTAEGSESAGASLTAFNSDGFSLGTDNATIGSSNNNGYTYVGWAFKGANTTVSNTSGSITSTVSANPTAGISVVSFGTATSGTSSTVGHGLGAVPKMIILKYRNAANNWVVHHAGIGTGYTLQLNTTSAQLTNTTNVNATSSTTFTLGSSFVDSPSQPVIAYCFAEVAGFSKFGSYTGNGSADGPFVYCGFRPKYVMVKRSDSIGSWKMWDAARNTYNATDKPLWADLTNAEGSGANIDLLSNGFKIRNTDTIENASGGTYIFMAFGESPFNYARAR